LAINTLSLFAGCVAIWSTTWLAITFQLGTVSPEVSVAWRFLLSGLAVGAWCLARRIPLRLAPAEHVAMAMMGVTMYSAGYVCVYYAEGHLASGLVAVGFSAAPLLSMFGLRLFFSQPLTARMAMGSLAGIAGIVLVFWPEFGRLSHDHNAGTGALFTLLAVLVSTAGGLLAHRNHRRALHGLAFMAWSMVYGGLFSFVLAMALGRPVAFDASAGYVLSLVYLALVGSIVAFACWLTLIGRIGPARASYVGVMVPVAALVLSTLFEHLEWNPLMAAGMLVSMAGNVLVLRNPPSASA
jgi:drug/metabolite transporter (DMT)-like permease